MKYVLSVVVMVFSLVSGAVFASAAVADINTAQLLNIVAESKGKVVMVNFFAAFCPPCRKEIPGLIKIRTTYSDSDFVIIGVSVDTDLEQRDKFIAKTRFNYPVYPGGDDVAYSFGVDSIPHNVMYDRSGEMVFNEAGYIPEARLRKFLDTLIKEK